MFRRACSFTRRYLRAFSDAPSEIATEPTKPVTISGFAKAFEKQTAQVTEQSSEQENRTFASLLRHSKFVDLGDPQGKIVYGEVYQIIENDLYIDFGWKFHCVCQKPAKNPDEFVVGTKVRLMINDLELSSRFIGSKLDLTLLEADCRLLNIVYTPVRR